MKLLISLVCLALASHQLYHWLGSHGTSPNPGEEAAPNTVVNEKSPPPEDTKTDEVIVDENDQVVQEAITDDNFVTSDSEINTLDTVDFYMYTVKDISGNDISLESYRGYVTLVVNVASQCAHTDSTYKDLVTLQSKFAPTAVFSVLAFPCNQFFDKEPGTNEEIMKFATEKYQVNFPIFGKSDLVGENATEAWQYLAEASGHAPQGNFYKYLIDHNGRVVDVWATETPAIQLDGWIEDAIGKAIADGDNQGFADYDSGTTAEGETTTHHDEAEL